MIECRFCDRTRFDREAMILHLVFWHSISSGYARVLTQDPERPVPEWLPVGLDERGAKLRQQRLPGWPK